MNSYLLAYSAFREGIFKLLCCTNTQKSLQADFRKDIICHLRPAVDLHAKLVILGDFNIQIDGANTGFVDFVETLFGCMQKINQCTTDSGLVLDLIFSNSEGFCDIIEAYWSDHKFIYCAINK